MEGAPTATRSPNEVCAICGLTEGLKLLRCGKCRSAMYCSKVCQLKDWPLHKIGCKIMATAPPGTYLTRDLPAGSSNKITNLSPAFMISVAVDPEREDSVRCEIDPCLMPGRTGSHPDFTPIPISNALGFPLGFQMHPALGLEIRNLVAEVLSTDCDPASPTFGRVLVDRAPTCAMAVARRDGRHLNSLHLQAFLEYVRQISNELRAVEDKENDDEPVDRQEIADRLLTPAAFAEAFRVKKEEELRDGDEDVRQLWEATECPVEQGVA